MKISIETLEKELIEKRLLVKEHNLGIEKLEKTLFGTKNQKESLLKEISEIEHAISILEKEFVKVGP